MNSFFQYITCGAALRKTGKCVMAGVLMNGMSTMALADNYEDKIIDYTAVQKSFSDNCAYIGETALEIDYVSWSTDLTDIVVTGTNSDNIVSELVRQEVERGRGNVTVFFDAGMCQQSIGIHLE